MKVLKYSSVTLPDVAELWQSYFKTPSVIGNYELACNIEKSLFSFGVDDVAVLIFMDNDTVKGILPISYEKSRSAWCYYPSYIFISVEVTIDVECWQYLPTLLPKPFIMYETSIKTVSQLSRLKIPWLTLYEANVIDLAEYTPEADPFNAYQNSLDKKTRSKFRNCLNRNNDVDAVITNKYDVCGGDVLRQSYMNYCDERFEEGQDFIYFKNQLALFPQIFSVASQLDQLVTLQISLNGVLVALNYSIFIGDCLYDYICYREINEDLDKRSLGTLAILKNINWLLTHHSARDKLYYDLASEFSYKKQFIPPYSSNYRYLKLSFD